MANKTITQLTTATPTPSADEIPFWDTSSAATRKATVASLLASMGVSSSAVASLGSAATADIVKWATDGRKVGEGSSAGTGVLVRSNGTNWIALDSGSTVAA